MSLNNSKYKEFYFGSLISEIYKAKAINKDDLCVTNNKSTCINYITRTGENNGCEMLADISGIGKNIIEKGNAITIGDTTATCFYQEKQFIAGDHMVVIRADWLNKYTGLYIVTLLTGEQYRYSYGRAFIKDNIKNTVLKLPVDEHGNPNREFMENFIKSLHYRPITTKNKLSKIGLNSDKWGEFKVGDLFPKIKVEKFSAIPESDGSKEFVSSTSSNNGVSKYVDENTINGNCITVSTNGDCFDCFYHENPIVVSNDVEVLYSSNLNKYTGMFICTVLETEKYKWSYGRKPKNDKVFDTIIKLPVNKNGEPDREFMENYIKNLPYGDRI